MKKIITLLIIAVLFAIPTLLIALPHKTIVEGENRKATVFPDFPSKLRSRSIKKYFKDFDSFFSDNIALRPLLAPMAFYLKQDIANDDLNINICVRGKSDWLYLGNNYNHTIEKLIGVYSSDYSIEQGVQNLLNIKSIADGLGAEFAVLIGPDKSSIYPEFLPAIFNPSKKRFLTPWVTAADRAGVTVYDPTQYLVSIKKDNILYYRTDTHWNSLAGYEVFKKLAHILQLPALPDVEMIPGPVVKGDLFALGGYSSFPLHEGDNFLVQWKEETSPLVEVSDNITRNNYAVLDKKVLILGDSFTTALMPFITKMFQTTYRYHHDSVTLEDLSKIERPDIVLVVCVERDFETMLERVGKLRR